MWYSADHFPVCVDVDMSIVPEVESITNNEANSVKWDTLSDESISQYKDATDQKLRNVYIPTDALNCTNTSCCDESHRAELNALYDDVIQCMQDASTDGLVIVMYVIIGEVGQVGMIILMSCMKELENVLLCGGMLGSPDRDLYAI